MNHIQPAGPVDAKLWIISDAPGKDEETDRFPVGGSTARFLFEAMHYSGIDPKAVRFENLTTMVKIKNKFEPFEEDKELLEVVRADIAALIARIKENKPNCVLLLGQWPLKYLFGETEVKDWRGHIVTHSQFPSKCIATYDPATILRQRFVDKKQHPGQFDALFYNDLKKANTESLVPTLPYPELNAIISPSFDETMDYLHDATENAPILSYDIEVLPPYDAYLMDCIGFATEKTCGICIPFWVSRGTTVERYWKSDAEFAAVLRAVQRLMESDVPKVAQNSQFDTIILEEYYDIRTRNLVYDTMVLAHDLYCELPKDLGTLMSIYTKLPYHKFMIGLGGETNRWKYNALDAIANLHVLDGQIKEAQELGVLNHYRNIPHLALRALVDMQRTGVRVDLPFLARAIAIEEQIESDIQEVLDQIIPVKFEGKKSPHMFNPSSWQQKNALFYDYFDCKKVYSKGKVSSDKWALDSIQEDDPRSFVKLIAEACKRSKAASSMLGKLQTPLRNGRIHTAYGIGGTDIDDKDMGTDTGRLSSGVAKLLDNSGTNLQNLKKGPQRQMLIPG